MAQTGVHMKNEGQPMPPRYAETMMLDAAAGQAPVLSDVELLARSYLWALEFIADNRRDDG